MRPPLTPKRIFSAARRGERLANRVVDTVAARIALAIAAVAPVIDPQLVVLGGGIAANGDLLVGRIERELKAISPFRPKVVASSLGDDAVLHGAVTTALGAAQAQLFRRAGDDRREIMV
jgi:predicted NBD/HSP70 family sugar kinase